METGTWKFNGVAKHSFVSQMTKCKESPEKKNNKKNLDGSSNTDGLKMKGCSSIQCLNRSFLLLNHLNIFAFLAFLEALPAFISHPTPAPSVTTAIGGKLLSQDSMELTMNGAVCYLYSFSHHHPIFLLL